MVDFTRANELTPEVIDAIDDAFEYHPWDTEQQNAGYRIRLDLATAVKTIIANVPPCPDRSAAIRKLREARMDCAALEMAMLWTIATPKSAGTETRSGNASR